MVLLDLEEIYIFTKWLPETIWKQTLKNIMPYWAQTIDNQIANTKNYLELNRSWIIFKPHIESLCKKASCIHERALMIVYKSLWSSFNKLLLKDNSFKVHHHNFYKLAIEIFKVKLDTKPALINTVFHVTENPYTFRNTI